MKASPYQNTEQGDASGAASLVFDQQASRGIIISYRLPTEDRVIMLVRTLMVRHSTLAREKGLDLAFRRRLSRENGHSVLKSGEAFSTTAAPEATNE